MLSNYFKISLRTLLKNPMFTALNVLGLALGLAVSMLLFLHVRQELSFDRFHSKAGRIHRVMLNAFWDPAKPMLLANVPNVVAPAAKAEIPAVEQAARVLKHEFGQIAFVTAGDNKLTEEDLYWADPSLADIFDIPVLAGNLKDALAAPNAVALSRSAAVRYFGTSNPVGQTIRIDRMDPLEVRAVYEDFPANSTLDAAMLGSFASIKWANKNLVWSNSSFETWLLLNADAQKTQVEQQLAALLDKNVPKDDQSFSMWLQPLTDVYFNSANVRWNYSKRVGDPKQATMLGMLALAVLLIACFNYMNLSTARSQLRFREVGINKTMGATRRQLAIRFYAETAVLTGISLLLAYGIMALGLPLFNRLTDKVLPWSSLFSWQSLALAGSMGAVVTLLAGSYPAFFLSAFAPQNLLKTVFRKDTGAGWLRRSLVTAQFAASMMLIVGTIVLYRQMQFVQQKKLGFEPEQVVAVMTTAAENKAQLESFKSGCLALSNVTAACRIQSYPGMGTSVRTLRQRPTDEDGMELLTSRADPGFEKVLSLKFLAGQSLPEKLPTDTIERVVLNESAVRYLGLSPEEAIGKKVACDLGDNTYVVGVVADFHFESLHKTIGAYAFHDADRESRRFMLVKMNTQNVPETMRQIESTFKNALPQSAFEFKFLDEHLEKLYAADRRTARTALVFSILAILVSCLGLFGLAAFTAEQRTKEIGIRKVLGASVANITGLLSRDFLKLVGVGIVLAAPMAYFLMQRWLADFAYRIDIQGWMFLAAGAIAVAIALFTVGLQSVRAALSNPVEVLRRD